MVWRSNRVHNSKIGGSVRRGGGGWAQAAKSSYPITGFVPLWAGYSGPQSTYGGTALASQATYDRPGRWTGGPLTWERRC